ncbi:MAG: hypothetical protein AMJ53_14595 [Gammaproteobacteria bacterium SG8_11]|nr:MAG: hypothetical protein AMJ53_14595 [Gammaproteobacteria bacterium SG8_11]
MKFDDASWHYDGEYPQNLPAANAYTHIGMFLAWALLNDIGGEFHAEEFPDELDLLQKRAITPGAYLQQCCDGKLTDEDLSESANSFAEAYYEAKFFEDYISTLADDLESPYHVSDTWDTYNKIADVLSHRFHEWQSGIAI